MKDIKKCPVCGTQTDKNGFRLIGVKQHITKTAKQEAWEYALGEIKETPHLDYYKEHTREIVVARKWE